MPYGVRVRQRPRRAVLRLPAADANAVIAALERLAEMPRPQGASKLRGAGLWRIRVGDYRVVHAIDDDEQAITVVRVGHRREVYRGL